MTNARFAWLVSYPRSGNTWLRLALEALIEDRPIDFKRRRLRTGVANRSEFDDAFAVASSELSQEEIEAALPALHRALAKEFEGPCILRKVHDRYRHTSRGEPLFPPELSLGAVYIARDPRDVAISLAAFRGVTIDETIAIMADPAAVMSAYGDGLKPQFEQPMGTWSSHVASWLNGSGMRVHLLRYEDMLSEPQARLADVAGFLGLPTDALTRAVEATRFDVLRAREDETGFNERPPTAARFFRQGRAGAWREVLTAEQCARIEETHGAAMARLGYL